MYVSLLSSLVLSEKDKGCLDGMRTAYEEQVAADLEALADAEPRVDPEGDEWADLDAEDADNLLMVSEYMSKSFKPFLTPLCLIAF